MTRTQKTGYLRFFSTANRGVRMSGCCVGAICGTPGARLKWATRGSFILIPAGVPHFVAAKDGTVIVQLNGDGKFHTNYVEKQQVGDVSVKAVAGSDWILFEKRSGYRSVELIVISTLSRGNEAHPSQDTRCVRRPAMTLVLGAARLGCCRSWRITVAQFLA
jgi:hypothetical protein